MNQKVPLNRLPTVFSVNVTEESHLPTPNSILKMNHDTLGLVFDFTSRSTTAGSRPSDLTRPLHSMRRASQVCRTWRCLILESPAIWGRLLDLDVLSEGNSESREEVLSRTQSSPLWIMGSLHEWKKSLTAWNLRTYFFKILNDPTCWNRLERLQITVYGSDISHQTWKTFYSPAPILRVFDVTLADLDLLPVNPLIRLEKEKLLGNHAPALWEFDVHYVEFSTSASWLSNLQILHVPVQLTVPQIQDLLLHAPHLRSIFFDHGEEIRADPEHISSDLSVSLSKLEAITMITTLEISSVLLQSITATHNCSLSWSTFHFQEDHVPDVVQHFLTNGLLRYISHYFNAYTSTRVRLEIMCLIGFHFDDASYHKEEGQFFNVHVLYEVDLVPLMVSEHINSLLFHASTQSPSSGSRFDKVIDLSLETLQDVSPTQLPDVYSLLSSFPSVTLLETNANSIRYLLSLFRYHETFDSANALPMFPHLHTLRLTTVYPYQHSAADDDVILQFLKQRAESGFPVGRLHLMAAGPKVLRDIGALDGIAGLEVVWKSDAGPEVYVCGNSGTVEKLRFLSGRAMEAMRRVPVGLGRR